MNPSVNIVSLKHGPYRQLSNIDRVAITPPCWRRCSYPSTGGNLGDRVEVVGKSRHALFRTREGGTFLENLLRIVCLGPRRCGRHRAQGCRRKTPRGPLRRALPTLRTSHERAQVVPPLATPASRLALLENDAFSVRDAPRTLPRRGLSSAMDKMEVNCRGDKAHPQDGPLRTELWLSANKPSTTNVDLRLSFGARVVPEECPCRTNTIFAFID